VDSDGPGANLLHDLSLRLGRHRCKWVQYPKGCKDLNDALREYGVRGVQESIRRAQWLRVEGVYRMSELPPVDPPKAYDIGIVGLWEHYRMRLGDFCVVTGLPGHGKSSFVNEVCCRMAQREKWTTVFASFEQSPQVDHRRALRSFYAEKMERAMSPEERAGADAWIDRHFAFIVPSEDDDPTLAWILEKIAAAIIRFDANIVVIDPFNEMSNEDRPEGMSMTEYVGFAIKQFKKLAKKYRVHLILVAHPAKMLRSKDGTYPIPGLWDIADSAQFSNKADIGIVVHRENMVDADTTIRVVKSRYFNQIGKPGQIKGRWAEEKTRFTIVDDGAGMRAA
jgi:twinkle protein